MPGDEAQRASPDALLALAKKEGRGHLKIFLGAAPGVGKTYAMLTSGRTEKIGGRDVVVGLVETHGRRETEQLLDGFEVLPRKPIVYRNQIMHEFDLDAALARRPGLLLVDEFAHTNMPGSRHPKRWQDVEELLAAGIDVWTTLNIQHLESLNDVVQKITKVRVRETVPDTVFDKADEIVLVDFPPDELLEAAGRGQGLCAGHRRQGGRAFLPPGEPDRAARTGAAARGRAHRRRPDRAHAGAGDRRSVGGGRAHPRLHRPRSLLAGRRAHGQAARRPHGRAVACRDGGATGRQSRRRCAPAGGRGDEARAKPRRRDADADRQRPAGRVAALRQVRERDADRDRPLARRVLQRAVAPLLAARAGAPHAGHRHPPGHARKRGAAGAADAGMVERSRSGAAALRLRDAGGRRGARRRARR